MIREAPTGLRPKIEKRTHVAALNELKVRVALPVEAVVLIRSANLALAGDIESSRLTDRFYMVEV